MRSSPASGKFFSAGVDDGLATKVASRWACKTIEFPNALRYPRGSDIGRTAAVGIERGVLHLADRFIEMWQVASARHLGSADSGRTDKHDASEVHFGHVRKTGPSSPQLSTRHGWMHGASRDEREKRE